MKGYGGGCHNTWLLVVLLILGGLFGSLLGQILAGVPALSFLGTGRSIGLPETRLDLEILTITFGFTFRVNLISFLGFVAAFALYRRL